MAGYRLGVDIGGSFTDIVLLSNDGDGECEDPFNDGLFNDLLEEEKDTENFHAQFDNEKHYFASDANPKS